MINILIFGTGKCADNLEPYIATKSINILGYIDNNKDVWNKYKNKVKIVSPNCIEKYNFDYIVIASVYDEEMYNQLLDLGVDETRIFCFRSYLPLKNALKIESINEKLRLDNKEYNGIVTGMSYFRDGISEKILPGILNLASGGQDLYYDYLWAKKALEKYRSIKYAIIGLAYTSFQYDISLSAVSNEIIPIYYNVLKDSHNYNIGEFDHKKDRYQTNKKISNIVLGEDTQVYNSVDLEVRQSNLCRQLDSKLAKEGKKLALKSCNKDYPKTLEENIKILKEYLDLLLKNEIKPIILVLPVSEFYSLPFPKKMKDEFINIINDFKDKYKFDFLDYFDDQRFNKEDFYEVTHLNIKGAEKVSRIVKSSYNF